jgi:molybdopterin-guanine dinucleotide biosynthesis adapter protein
MAPIISIVGRSKSGKTTLVEKLITELISRGYRVATMKHTPMGMSWNEDDKDSQRHLRAGSEATIICDPTRLVMVKPVGKTPPLEEIARLFGEDYDIVITEGFKQDDAPKIEVHRRGVAPPLKDVKKLFAITTDEPLDTKVRQFALDDVKGIANLLEEGFIKPQKERLLLYVNDEPIALSAFPRDIITNMLLGMANSLKGVGQIKNLKIFLRRG